MLHQWSFSTAWRRFFSTRPDPTTRSAPAASAGAAAFSASARASRPRRPAPVPGSEAYWLAMTSFLLPESAKATLEEGLRRAVRTRAYWGQTLSFWPDENPYDLPEWVRFGIHGEVFVPQASDDLQQLVIKELKRAVHTLEAPGLSRIERGRRLGMHSARLEELYREQGRRACPRAPLEELRLALAALLG